MGWRLTSSALCCATHSWVLGILGTMVGWAPGGGCYSLALIKHHYKGLLNFLKIHELTGGYAPFISSLRRKIVVYLAFD